MFLEYEVVRKLIGPIEPLGDSYADDKRLQNLKTLIKLTDKLLGDISQVAMERHSTLHSEKIAGIEAHNFLHSVADTFGDEL